MKNNFHKYMAIVLAVMVVFSTVSVTLSMHFCGDKMAAVTVLQNVKKCCAAAEKSEDITQITKKSCCSDLKITKQAQTEIQTPQAELSLQQQIFVTSFVSAYWSLFTEQNKQDLSFVAYSPPLVIKPIYKLDEVYLI